MRPFFRAVFPDHRAQPPLLLHPFFYIKEEKKPLSSRRVKRLFSNLLADIGFITSLSFHPPPRHSNVVSCAFHSSSLSASPYCHVEKPPLLGRVMACKRLSTHTHHSTRSCFFADWKHEIARIWTRALFNLQPEEAGHPAFLSEDQRCGFKLGRVRGCLWNIYFII